MPDSSYSGFAYREYKGSVNGGTDTISRVFSVKSNGDRVYVELKNGPGWLTDTGAIQPNGKPAVEITVPFKTYEARRLALTISAYIYNWELLRMAAQRQQISSFSPFTLSPTAEGFGTMESNDQSIEEPNHDNLITP